MRFLRHGYQVEHSRSLVDLGPATSSCSLGTTVSHVLVLDGVEFILFTVAGQMCLEFVLKSVDNTGTSSLLLRRDYTFLPPIPPVRRLGMHKKLGGAQPGQLTPRDHRDISQTSWSHSPYINLWEEEEGGSKWWCVSSHVTIPHDAFLQMAEHLPGRGTW